MRPAGTADLTLDGRDQTVIPRVVGGRKGLASPGVGLVGHKGLFLRRERKALGVHPQIGNISVFAGLALKVKDLPPLFVGYGKAGLVEPGGNALLKQRGRARGGSSLAVVRNGSRGVHVPGVRFRKARRRHDRYEHQERQKYRKGFPWFSHKKISSQIIVGIYNYN